MVLAAAAALGCAVYANVTGLLLKVAEEQMRAFATAAVHEAALESLRDINAYSDLVCVERDETGAIATISADAYKVNRIARETAYLAQQKLQKKSEEGVNIPLGAFTGIDALAGFGSTIRMKILPVAAVSCRFASGFESAGVNQTRHSVYIQVIADISVVLPGRTRRFSSLTEILAAETVIAGAVPDWYLQSDLFGNGYQLAPSVS